LVVQAEEKVIVDRLYDFHILSLVVHLTFASLVVMSMIQFPTSILIVIYLALRS
jgi:hypothetical protein